jgi:hypothetical protein
MYRYVEELKFRALLLSVYYVKFVLSSGEIWASTQVPAALPQVAEGLDLTWRVEQVSHSQDILVHSTGNSIKNLIFINSLLWNVH